jgi:citrate synthase
MALGLEALAIEDAGSHGASPARELERARALLFQLCAVLALRAGVRNSRRVLAAPTIAKAVAWALELDASPAQERAINAALIVCADHELNASTFAARIAASAGADLYACLAAGLVTLSGTNHGGTTDRVEALIDELLRSSDKDARAALEARSRRGEDIPGFGHILYPDGDARPQPLLAMARQLAPQLASVKALFAAVDWMQRKRGEYPSLDLGLVAIASALQLPRHSALALFAVGRTAGWIAHILEQREAGFVLRPRARYVGVPSSSPG